MAETTSPRSRNDPSGKPKSSIFSARTATWLALAALLVSVGHVVYAIWRDHINGGEGLLSVLG